jgi:hypothetical protein
VGTTGRLKRETTMKVENYTLTTAAGRKIRTATKVTLPCGRVIRFTELLSKREAVRQAEYQLSRGN